MKQPSLVPVLLPTCGSESSAWMRATPHPPHGTCRRGRDVTLPHIDRNAAARAIRVVLEAKL